MLSPSARAPSAAGRACAATLRRLALLAALLAAGSALANEPAPCEPRPPASVGEAAFPCSDGRISCEPWSGVAIGGFDPVAYRVEGGPRAGRAACSALHAGVAWLFGSGANRDAFLEAPAAYLPAFGGYDALGVSRGVAVRADPTVALVPARGPAAGRLLLFADEAARDAFAADEGLALEAERQWPALLRRLTP